MIDLAASHRHYFPCVMVRRVPPACSVDGCNVKPYARSLCTKHYSRWRRHGDPNVLLHPREHEEKVCAVDGCDRLRAKREWCGMHYFRVMKHGSTDSPEKMERIVGVPIRERFDRRWALDTESGCWLWQASLSESGYGRIDRGYAHRVGYELYVGPVPDGLVLDHLCCVKQCVNPAHLEPITPGLNLARGILHNHLDEVRRWIARHDEVVGRAD